ncbi:MAG TPA: DHA2 family efflux MFS transporter permease subunit [Sphingomonas sp.]|uniref:DHA2 family efflux MFS transporter permease subunit n=1 Tax=Sphingomonas sp. TaxID=28214 RepID=UPI002ED96B6A
MSAWLAVAAGTLGSFMATLDISIVNAALPTIQGEIGASGTEGTWISTAYLVSEIVIIPLSGWLERVFGLRTFLMIAAILFTIFSVVCGLSTNLDMMIVGRVGQGFTGGAMIPTAMTIIATRLPPQQQPIGTSLFAATAILGPVLGPIIGGWITENYSWHYAFFLNVPVCAGLITLLLNGLPAGTLRLHELARADWLGIAGLAIGLGGLTVVLEEGQRELWFESTLILQLTALSAVGFLLLIAGQLLAERPVIKLSLLFDRQFGSVFVMGLVLGMVLYGTSYVIPQFLANAAGYNALQSGSVVFISGIPSLLMMPFVPILFKRLDVRLAVGFGFMMMALSCWTDTTLTIDSRGGAFTDSQLLRGVGQIMVMLFLNQSAISAVSPRDAGDASGLFNAARNLGGSVGLALIATVQDKRQYFHEQTLATSVQANGVLTQERMQQMQAGFGGAGDPVAGAIRQLYGQIQQQALVMSFNDLFVALTIGILAAMPLILFLRPLPKAVNSAAVH